MSQRHPLLKMVSDSGRNTYVRQGAYQEIVPRRTPLLTVRTATIRVLKLGGTSFSSNLMYSGLFFMTATEKDPPRSWPLRDWKRPSEFQPGCPCPRNAWQLRPLDDLLLRQDFSSPPLSLDSSLPLRLAALPAARCTAF